MASVQARVVSFLSTVREEVGEDAADNIPADEDLVDYVVGFVEDCSGEAELVECLQAFIEPFETLPCDRRASLAKALLAEAPQPPKCSTGGGGATDSAGVGAAIVTAGAARTPAAAPSRTPAPPTAPAPPPQPQAVAATTCIPLVDAVDTFLAKCGGGGHDGTVAGDLAEFVRHAPSEDDVIAYAQVLSPSFLSLPRQRKVALVRALLAAAAHSASTARDESHGAADASTGSHINDDARTGAGQGAGGSASTPPGGSPPPPDARSPPSSKGSLNRHNRGPQRSTPKARQNRRNGRRGKRSGDRDLRPPASAWTLADKVKFFVSHDTHTDVDHTIAEYIAAFLDDADNVAPSVVAEDSPLSDIVESMVPEFTSLTPHDRSLCVQRLLDCGRRHHAAVIAQQAQQQRQARLRLERQRSEAQRRVVAAAAAAKREENQHVTAPAVVRERKDTLITDPRVGMLAELQASVPVDMIPCIIDRFNGNMDDAAAFLLDPRAERKQEEYLAAQRQREEEERLKLEADALAAEEARRSVMKRYDEEVDTKHKRYKPKARLDNRDRKAMRKEKRFYQNKVVYIKAGKQFFAEDA